VEAGSELEVEAEREDELEETGNGRGIFVADVNDVPESELDGDNKPEDEVGRTTDVKARGRLEVALELLLMSCRADMKWALAWTEFTKESRTKRKVRTQATRKEGIV
jgi:hypothetical protein